MLIGLHISKHFFIWQRLKIFVPESCIFILNYSLYTVAKLNAMKYALCLLAK